MERRKSRRLGRKEERRKGRRKGIKRKFVRLIGRGLRDTATQLMAWHNLLEDMYRFIVRDSGQRLCVVTECQSTDLTTCKRGKIMAKFSDRQTMPYEI